ncbi:hypothetical protein BO78DRAFT_401928 [Aspergillus sclerotiicarbonarius CBS 121057]|uniref:Uncharacterized protein n=1 Tax=Aspergillus sclerotiicarbonarius (strain CBS 121057 / IBT 28362) TaxID=1448318 RepID=A0A319DSP0_ASPSB|nr:hypothetical protein BO78DRAFT_401928 [Aspergillus sclerotiicarbonarius CBS 121057]
MATGHILTQRPDEELKSHVNPPNYSPLIRTADWLTRATKLPRLSLKDGGKHIFAISMDPQAHNSRDASLRSTRDGSTIASESPSIKVHPSTPPNEPVGNVRRPQGLRRGFQHTEEREILTDSVHTMLHPDAKSDEFYDVTFWKPDNNPLLRCMTVDSKTDVCAMHFDVWQDLKLPIERYEGPPISIVGHEKPVRPLGKAQATWSKSGEDRRYSAEFYVVRGLEFDACLGASTVRKLGLYRRDPALASRLRAADHANVNSPDA